ncbi:ornithine decarboxylase-like [Amphiprion ocellaris]|uniref:ornithine decarboxylase n=1 Tax=Amphiprion ocellaris TaxID=80972 RepID=A0A3Q1C4I3_AMPOC|nr:ornithine decarboxylase-like [Amphiprion ocellaris]
MEEIPRNASVTTNGSVMRILSTDNKNIEILENGKSISDVIDRKIKELSTVDNEEPFYVLNLDSLLKRHLRWITNLPRVKPFYAMKCNNTPAVVRMLMALGIGFDCASKAEIQHALSLGATPDKMVYAHTTKPLSHIRYACTHGVDVMTFDSEDELLKISLCHSQAKLILRIATDDSKSLVRLSTKFGARMASVGKLLEQAGELGLEVIGVSFHVGSGCTSSLAYKKAIADARLVFNMASLLGFQMKLLDIGGGFSAIGDFQDKFEEFSDVINEALDKFFPPDSGVEIIAEPGRYYVESAFTLAVNVMAKRVVASEVDEQNNGEENSPDKMIMYYITDGVYGSMSCITADPVHSKLEPYPHRAVDGSEPRYPSVIWGPTCDSIDKITENYWLPELHVGEWLLIDNMGAYSVSQVSDFNSFERARIYPVVSAKTWDTLNLSHTYAIIH